MGLVAGVLVVMVWPPGSGRFGGVSRLAWIPVSRGAPDGQPANGGFRRKSRAFLRTREHLPLVLLRCTPRGVGIATAPGMPVEGPIPG